MWKSASQWGVLMAVTSLNLVANIYLTSDFSVSKTRTRTISGVHGFLEKRCILVFQTCRISSPPPHWEFSELLVLMTWMTLKHLIIFPSGSCGWFKCIERLCAKTQMREGANMLKLQSPLPTDLPLVQSHYLYLWHSLLCVPDCSETRLVLLILINKAPVWESGSGALGYPSGVY